MMSNILNIKAEPTKPYLAQTAECGNQFYQMISTHAGPVAQLTHKTALTASYCILLTCVNLN